MIRKIRRNNNNTKVHMHTNARNDNEERKPNNARHAIIFIGELPCSSNSYFGIWDKCNVSIDDFEPIQDFSKFSESADADLIADRHEIETPQELEIIDNGVILMKWGAYPSVH